MNKIESFKQLIGFTSLVKKSKGSLICNIYPNEGLYKKALQNGKLFYTEIEGGVYILEDKGDFFCAYFAAGHNDDVLKSIQSLSSKIPEDKPIVIEHILRSEKDKKIGTPTAVLKRMIHSGDFINPLSPAREANDSIRLEYVTDRDILLLQNLLNRNFNPLMERIPDIEELKMLSSNNGIIVAKDNDEIAGFIIFEKEGLGLHLRYWWISHEHRGKGIGSALMSYYFEASKGTRRQYLWVFEDNENAIDRYRHYGFDFEGIQDDIYIINTRW